MYVITYTETNRCDLFKNETRMFDGENVESMMFQYLNKLKSHTKIDESTLVSLELIRKRSFLSIVFQMSNIINKVFL
jgi:hypothetical protein